LNLLGAAKIAIKSLKIQYTKVLFHWFVCFGQKLERMILEKMTLPPLIDNESHIGRRGLKNYQTM
jgi:hypothetical protein